ncbi:hypothetical protein H311_02150 [Anncaliia algerae PRA109]|nr:hypothetical protein H311_02150 [Anncaliia algerae PRA109]
MIRFSTGISEIFRSLDLSTIPNIHTLSILSPLLYFLFPNYDSSIFTSMFESPSFLKTSIILWNAKLKTILISLIDVVLLISNILHIREFFSTNIRKPIIAHTLKKNNLSF